MAWTTKQLILAFVMVFTGSINTLSTKWADTMRAAHKNGEKDSFNHPFFQADGMFLGEILCMGAFFFTQCYSRRQRQGQMEMSPSDQGGTDFPKYIFFVPAMCDMLATSTMYLGLTLTYASSFQMLRGAVIVFTGLLSVAFLGRKLRYFNWAGIFIVLCGLVIVGVSDFMGTPEEESEYTLNGIITGDLLIICAQIVTATQMVIEEKFVTRYNVPALLAVGWEGTFGFLVLSILLVPMYWIPAGIFSGNPREVLEDVPDAFYQMGSNPVLVAAVLGNIISIAFFNFAGVSVTKELTATTRMVLDSVRTLVIWGFSLAVQWQEFQYLQPIGFTVLVIGMFVYNDMIFLPFARNRGWINDSPGGEEEPVIPTNSSGRSSVASIAKDSPDATVEPM